MPSRCSACSRPKKIARWDSVISRASLGMRMPTLRVLREAGRDVPGEVSVVGFDDAPLALSTEPPLSTVHQSPERMGREMVDLLLATLAHPDEPQEGRVLSTHLVVRGSS